MKLGSIMSEEDYSWEKAEFQDPVSYQKHVENYVRGKRSSIAFDKQYAEEALKLTMKGEKDEESN